MGIVSRARARLRGLFRRDVVAGEIREELEFHVDMRANDYERAGSPRPLAIEQARRRFGNLSLWQDHGYDIRGGGVMETVVQDVRYAARLLIRQPGFSVVAILTLALGIGMTTAIASVIDAAMLHPLPYPHPEQLVQINVEVPRPDRPAAPARYAPSLVDLQTIRAMPNPAATVAMWRNIFRPPIVDGPEPERLRGMEVDEYFLGIFGIVPVLGRGIQAQDTVEGAPAVVLLSHAYWLRRFGGKDDVIGQRLRLDNETAEIVGVMPRTFFRNTPLWVPLKVTSAMAPRRGSGAVTYARLRSDISMDQAKRELSEVFGRVQTSGETGAPGITASITTLLERETNSYWTTANILLGAVGLILLIACVNVAGLLLARGATRLHEVAIRASIGAGRGRLIRQLLTESLLLAFAGGAVGVLVAWWTLDSLVANIPLPVSSNAPAAINWRVLGFSLLVALITGVLFGLVPALRLSRVRVTNALARGTRRAGSALSRRGGQWLIGIEIALALILVTGAGLMIRSFGRLVSVDLGFQPESILTLQASPAELKSPVFSNYYTTLLDSIRQMPAVEVAGAINHLPLMGSASFTQMTLDSGKTVSITWRQVLPGYFEAMGLQPVAGRFPQQVDFTSGRSVIVVGQRAARELFPNGTAVGRVITFQKQPSEIIGVTPEIRVDGAEQRREYQEVFTLYRPLPDARPDSLVMVVRPKQPGAALNEPLRQMALTVGPRAIVERVRTGADWLDDTVVTPRRRTVLLALLGGLGLLLTLVGVFGMTAYAVSRRTQEIGVRIAFGARPVDVVRAMVADATFPVFAGIAVGLAGGWFATRLISTFLFQTEPTDVPTFAGAAVALAVAAFLAVWLPARRAARVDPVTSLRAE
jgi:putative ABC transport system permease protein